MVNKIIEDLVKPKEEEEYVIEARNRLDKLYKKNLSQETFDDFAWVFKIYIKFRLNINYEFTYEELVKELSNRKIAGKDKILKIAETILQVNYMNKKISDREFKQLINLFRDIL
jgi:hypothetical protein